MARTPVHTVDSAPSGSQETLKHLEARVGKVINIFGALAHSPALLNQYAAGEEALAEHGTLDAATTQAIRLTVAGANECRYCQSAYTLAARAAGLTEAQTVEVRRGAASFDPALEPLLVLARQIATRRGYVDDGVWEAARAAGWRDDQLLEVFANVARTILTNYFNHLVGVDLDVPAAPGLE